MINFFFKLLKLKKLNGRFILRDKISSGNSSICFFGIDTKTKQDIFIKFLICPRTDLEKKKFKFECERLKSLTLTVKLEKKLNKNTNHTTYVQPGDYLPEYIAHGEKYSGLVLYLITERVQNGINLSDWISNKLQHTDLSERLLVIYRVYMALILSRVTDISAHRDLHPGNIILLDNYNNIELLHESSPPFFGVKIIDLGQYYSSLCANYANEGDDILTIHHGIGKEISTSFYNLPPEIFSKDLFYRTTRAYDTWAMGLLLYKILVGNDLFNFHHIGEYAYSVATDDITNIIAAGKSTILDKLGNDCLILAELFYRLMNVNPSRRIELNSAREIIWFFLIEEIRLNTKEEVDKFFEDPPSYKSTWKHADNSDPKDNIY